MKESLVHIKSSFITNGQPAVVVEPSQSALDHPPVPAQPLCALDPSSGNTRDDAPLPPSLPASNVVVSFVSMQLGRSLTTPSAKLSRFLYRFDSINYISKSVGVVNVSSRADYGKGNSPSVDHNMALR